MCRILFQPHHTAPHQSEKLQLPQPWSVKLMGSGEVSKHAHVTRLSPVLNDRKVGSFTLRRGLTGWLWFPALSLKGCHEQEDQTVLVDSEDRERAKGWIPRRRHVNKKGLKSKKVPLQKLECSLVEEAWETLNWVWKATRQGNCRRLEGPSDAWLLQHPFPLPLLPTRQAQFPLEELCGSGRGELSLVYIERTCHLSTTIGAWLRLCMWLSCST